MKELYEEFFHIPKNGKIHEKVMICRTAVTVMIMVVCLIAMSVTAYAYFSHEVTSGSNMIKAANFNAIISITTENGSFVDPSSKDGDMTTFTFAADGTYKVNIKKGNSSSKTGFCILYVGNNKYHTQQITQNGGGITFSITVSANMQVGIMNHWGTSSYYGYENLENNPRYITDTKVVDLTLASTAINEDGGVFQTVGTEFIHIVEENENLTKIAKKYGTTVPRIAAYNEISDPGKIQVNQELKIPPENWQMPSDALEETPETEDLEQTEPTTNADIPSVTENAKTESEQ
ncbi:MAG: LysM peptidoglycan-binding domain-containing protein [Clostridia bacterium]|nr:LysM peptidoglycan-binding domain-containing protein [Clostridia bacterium]